MSEAMSSTIHEQNNWQLVKYVPVAQEKSNKILMK